MLAAFLFGINRVLDRELWCARQDLNLLYHFATFRVSAFRSAMPNDYSYLKKTHLEDFYALAKFFCQELSGNN
jgi:hypothetical protein